MVRWIIFFLNSLFLFLNFLFHTFSIVGKCTSGVKTRKVANGAVPRTGTFLLLFRSKITTIVRYTVITRKQFPVVRTSMQRVSVNW